MSSLFTSACFGQPNQPDTALMLRDPLVIKVARVPASIAATVGWRVTSPDPELTVVLKNELKKLGLIAALESAQISADVKGAQAVYLDDGVLTLDVVGEPIFVVLDRNFVGEFAKSRWNTPESTVSRFWLALTDYRQVLDRLKRRLATVVIFKEHGLKRELENSDDPQAYLEELTGELYHSLGNTGILVIDSQSDAEVLDISLNNIEKAVEPWQQMLLASAGGLTEQQLWGGTKRSLGLSGIDEQSRRATGEVVDAITTRWAQFATEIAQDIAFDMGSTGWQEVSVAFNPYEASTLLETAQAQRQAAEADQRSIDMGVLTPEEVRESRHAGEGFGTEITLAREEQT